MNSSLARALQTVTIVALFGLLLAQVVVVPVVSGWMAEAYPEFAWARWPLAVPLIAVLACVQVVLVATWRLLGMVADDEIFDGASRRWVDLIIGTLAVGWLVALGTSLWQTVVNVSAPWIVLGELVGLLVSGALVLLVVVLRGLLVRATELQLEMDAVV